MCKAIYNRVFRKNTFDYQNDKYMLWIKNNEPNEQEIDKQRKFKFEYEPKISVIVPMYNTKEQYISELIESLTNQTYTNWELCLADGSEEKRQFIDELVNQDKRIKYRFLNGNQGISENSNKALELATGEYIALLDHDCQLNLNCKCPNHLKQYVSLFYDRILFLLYHLSHSQPQVQL